MLSRRFLGAVAALLLSTPWASAAPVAGYFTDFNAGSTAPAAGITAAGFTPLQILNIGTQNFSGLSLLVINESNNGSPSAALLSRTADLAAFVAGGGVLVVHSRNVAQGTPDSTWVPGMGGVSLTTNLSTNIDVVTPGILPGITNTNLDGGNFSNHGFGAAGSLPAGAINILSNGNPAQSVAFGFQFGSGFVYYSTIPLDFYLGGSGNNPPADTFRTTYFQGALRFAAAQAVPEPASLALFGGAALAAGYFGWRRRKPAAA